MQIARRFAKSHIVRNALFMGTTYAVSEFTQQSVIADQYDRRKIIHFGVWGLCISGPANHVWYRFLDTILSGVAAKTVAKKVVFEACTVNPIMMFLFYVVFSIFERKDDIFAEAKQKFIPSYLASWAFWGPAQVVNFFLVPPVYRVVYVGTAAFLWANILCVLKRQEIDDPSISALNHGSLTNK